MNTNITCPKTIRSGFTLVELVVVILVMGIVAAVAAPKMFDTAKDARENSTFQSLLVVRNAIQLYKSKEGVYPGEAGTDTDLKADLVDYLQGQFPKNQLADSPAGTVGVTDTADPLTVSGSHDWRYSNVSGEFIINTTGFSDR